MFKPLSSSATQRAHTSCPSSSNLNVWNLHIQCVCVAQRRNGIAEAASTQRLTTANVWNYSLQETSAKTICPHDGGEVMVKYRDPHSPPVQKQTTHWERANTHLGNKHDKNWKQGANAHLSEMLGILWRFSGYDAGSDCTPGNKQQTDNGFTREIKELLQLPFLSLVHLVITWKGVNALTSSSYWPFTSSNNSFSLGISLRLYSVDGLIFM